MALVRERGLAEAAIAASRTAWPVWSTSADTMDEDGTQALTRSRREGRLALNEENSHKNKHTTWWLSQTKCDHQTAQRVRKLTLPPET